MTRKKSEMVEFCCYEGADGSADPVPCALYGGEDSSGETKGETGGGEVKGEVDPEVWTEEVGFLTDGEMAELLQGGFRGDEEFHGWGEDTFRPLDARAVNLCAPHLSLSNSTKCYQPPSMFIPGRKSQSSFDSELMGEESDSHLYTCFGTHLQARSSAKCASTGLKMACNALFKQCAEVEDASNEKEAWAPALLCQSQCVEDLKVWRQCKNELTSEEELAFNSAMDASATQFIEQILRTSLKGSFPEDGVAGGRGGANEWAELLKAATPLAPESRMGRV
jgi:hypothetical protein